MHGINHQSHFSVFRVDHITSSNVFDVYLPTLGDVLVLSQLVKPFRCNDLILKVPF